MDWVTALFKVLEAGLNLWGSKEANKYRDELAHIKTAYYDEKTKPDPNMAVLDDLEHQLFVLSGAFSTATAGGPAAPSEIGRPCTLL